MLIYVRLTLVFVVGVVVGSFLNVCIARLPLEKKACSGRGRIAADASSRSRWHRQRAALQLSAGAASVECRDCGSHYSFRYFAVELLTGLGYAGLFYLEVIEDDSRLAAVRARPVATRGRAASVGSGSWVSATTRSCFRS